MTQTIALSPFAKYLCTSVKALSLSLGIAMMGQFASAQDTSAALTLPQLQTKYLSAINNNNWSEAANVATEAYALGKQTYNIEDPKLGELAGQLGRAQLQLGDTSSIDILTQAIAIQTRAFGDESEKLVPVLMDFGASQVLVREIERSEDTFDQAFDIAEKTFGRGSTMLAKMNSQAGAAYFDAGEYRLASSYIYDAYEIYKTMFGSFSSTTGDAAYRVAKLKEALGNYAGMALSLKQATATFADPTTPSNEYEREVHRDLIVAYHASNKPEKATPHVLALARTGDPSSTEPTLVVEPSPSYRGSKLDGTVTIRYDVDAQGFVRNAELVENEGNRKLVTAAMKALDGYRFIPVVKDGQTVRTSGLETKIIFKWDDA